nr:immunoglobulin heavy chain junction region [Macaca mulatta]MOV36472.1 immunoglobulin heavy chain junction region [Macaca mulatta]MOV36848.1 immunoglobulin heavy chain junction region [Macaca mulatta]
CARGYRFW